MKVVIVGFGVVGSGVAEVLRDNAQAIAQRCKETVELGYIVDLREPPAPWTPYWKRDFSEALDDPAVGVVVEAIGGLHPAYEFTKEALASGRHVVTSNKELVANFGAELTAFAAAHGVNYLFEASVGGGIPLLGPLMRYLGAERVTDLWGILNGTTNFIMTRMNEEEMSFPDALALAQKNGYAEANPAADVEGHDACRKTAILASLLTGKRVLPQDVATEGITALTAEDVAAAEALGCAIKLLCRVRLGAQSVFAEVAPALIPVSSPLAAVGGVFNAVLVRGAHLGDAMFYGRGAGKLPTANAVVSDIVEAVEDGGHLPYFDWSGEPASVEDASQHPCVWMLRAAAEDAESISEIFGAAQKARVGEETVFLTMRLTAARMRSLFAEAARRGVTVHSALRVAEF